MLFHRGHEHSGRIAHLVDELGLPGHGISSPGMRAAIGRSPGERG
ncbi:hypothetical protein ACU4HD_42870 [Cupriavidus basilensis]